MKRLRSATMLASISLAAAWLAGCGLAPVQGGTPNVTMDGTGVGSGEGSLPEPRTGPKGTAR